MRKSVRLFVAGSKALEDERTVIGKAILGLNSHYKSIGKKCTVYLDTYETISGDNQPAYNKFIESEANLVFFVLDGKVGGKTLKELVIALAASRKENGPEVKIFVKHDETNSDEEYLELTRQLMGENYYVEYDNLDDLRSKAEKRVKEYVEKSTHKSLSEWIRCNYKFIVVLAIILSLAFVGFYMWYKLKLRENEPTLILAGGGSAANYMEKYYINCKPSQYKDGYYVHMPTSYAWLLMAEEVISPLSAGKRRYYPICLSAEKATDSAFTRIVSVSSMLAIGSVIEYRIGWDTLTVFLKSDRTITTCINDNKKITRSELLDLIKKRKDYNINLFTTSKGSGTRDAYEKLLADLGYDFANVETYQFAENSDMPTINKNGAPYMLMGSGCYVAKELLKDIDSRDCYEYKVVDENGDCFRKPIYIYFMAYCSDNSNVLTIPEQTLNFLNKLGVDCSKKVKDGKVKRYSTETVIQDFNKLGSW